MAADINIKTATALEYIRTGYIQYGINELTKLAAVNDLAAQFYVAVCYEQGIGKDKDMNLAFRMYRKAAERGLPDAMINLASFYRRGIVVPQSSLRENDWIKRYNQKGGQSVLPNLIQLYNEGLNHLENYALDPNGNNQTPSLITQSNGNSIKEGPTINNITIIQQSNETSKTNQPVKETIKSDVDTNIPITQQVQENTFALIIANENYQEVSTVPNALNDGAVFAEYCNKTLGIPQSNIKLATDVTLNGIQRQVNWLCK